MKILWASNAPFVASGYGNQTDLFTRRLQRAGHQVVIAGTFGHSGATINQGGIKVLASSLDQYGNDVLEADILTLQPDVAVLLYDAWVMRPEILRHLAIWAPIDHDPMTDMVRDHLLTAKHTWAMSRFGERQMRKAGLDPWYVPHGVDTTAYAPMERAEARRRWHVDDGTFLAVMVAANKGFPARKGFDRVFKAWAGFVAAHPDSLLYVHTLASAAQNGLDLVACAEFYGISASVRFADPYGLARGRYGADAMNGLYNAADGLVAPSLGEGFGIPVIEAQAAGCPVIVSDFTAQSELAGPGYKVPIHDDDRVYTIYGSEWGLARPSEIRKGLEWAFEMRRDEGLRAASRAFALQYDADKVFDEYLHPAICGCAGASLRDALTVEAATKPVIVAPVRTAFAEAKAEPSHVVNPACRDGHDWAAVGVWDHGELCVPCRRAGCPAELAQIAGGRQIVRETGFETVINGVALDLDDGGDGIAKIVCREARTSYGLGDLALKAGDVVLDVGAHVGVISIYLAKAHPDVRVIAYEPMPDNFARLQRNLQANGVTTVEAVNMAVSGDGRELVIGASGENSGGHSAFTHVNGNGVRVPSRTLAQVLEAHGVERLALLKIDCEGAEYEILTSTTAPLGAIEHLRGELHTNARLRADGRDPQELLALLAAAGIDAEAHVCPIAE